MDCDMCVCLQRPACDAGFGCLYRRRHQCKEAGPSLQTHWGPATSVQWSGACPCPRLSLGKLCEHTPLPVKDRGCHCKPSVSDVHFWTLHPIRCFIQRAPQIYASCLQSLSATRHVPVCGNTERPARCRQLKSHSWPPGSPQPR